MLRLADHLYGTVVGETPILFDVAKGRYLLLRGPAAENFRTLWDNESTSGGVAPLIEAGLVHDASTVKFEPGPQSAEVSYEDGSQPLPSRRLTIGAIHAQIVVRRALRRQKLPGVLKTLRARSGAPSRVIRSATHVTEADVSSAFVRSRLLLPSLDQCVARSIAIVSILGRYGHDATLIVGVRLPFAAHCWVQCENRVVSDPLDRARAFQPIFAL
ncbi:lasso peptide biosynthesis B2 protein [Sphingomonas glacialis]|uniref:Lasso peptide biosynthesis B2 protein n=1 Tax=Sphingomonas glacialis TaxID=658225 RepID=A0A502FQC8_9SPHN|nr:lasso peptide biosynthesis B2 protein [Sphingomonas glacialis]TPG51757.1 lasso peptide biosynthesis B2 protein [Sphingomonas glacialis]